MAVDSSNLPNSDASAEPAAAKAAWLDSPPHAARLKEIFLRVADLPASDRALALDEACGGDASLRRDVDRLLELDAHAAASPGVTPDAATLESLWNEPADDLDVGPLPEQIGRYAIIELLGMGTGGLVYKGRQREPNRDVAVKLLRVDGPIARRRFERESELMGGLHHPGIAHVYERGIDPQTRLPYIAMELVPGSLPVTTYADRQGLRLAERVGLMLQACEAVQHAHAAGVLHRDLKPANLLVGDDGRLKIVDFGVARLLDAGGGALRSTTMGRSLVGTLDYASPEQLRGDAVVSGDVYSLGAVLYELICGRPPVDLDSVPLIDALARIRSSVPVSPRRLNRDCGTDLAAVVLKAVAADAARRYPTAAQFAEDLERTLDGRAVSARHDGPWRTLTRAARQRPFAAGVLAAAATAVLAWTGWSWRTHALQMQAASDMTVAAVKALAFVEARPGSGPIRRAIVDTYLPVTEQMVATRPSDQASRYLLARLLETQAGLLLDAQDEAAAVPLRRRALSILSTLCDDVPESVEYAHQKSLAIIRVGDLLAGPDPSAMAEHYRRAMDIQQSLVDAGQTDAALLDDLGWSYGRMARLCHEQGRVDEGLEWTRRQLEMSLRVRAIDPAAPRSYWLEAYGHARATSFLGREDQREERVKHMLQGIVLMERLLEMVPDHRVFIIHYSVLALAYARDRLVPDGRHDEAVSLANKVRGSLDRLLQLEPDSADTQSVHQNFMIAWRDLMASVDRAKASRADHEAD